MNTLKHIFSRELEVAVYWRDYRAMSAVKFLRLEDFIDTQQVTFFTFDKDKNQWFGWKKNGSSIGGYIFNLEGKPITEAIRSR